MVNKHDQYILWLRTKPKVGQKTLQDNVDKTNADANGLADNLKSLIASGIVTKIDEFSTKLQTAQNTLIGIVKSAENLNSSLGISTKTSVNIAQNFQKISEQAENSSLSYLNFTNSAIKLQSVLPGLGKNFSNLAKLTDNTNNSAYQILQTHTKLSTQLGINSGEANAIATYMASTGDNVADTNNQMAQMASSIEIATGETGVLRDMFDALGKTSAATRLTLKGTTLELSAAALQANRMGTTLDSMVSSADRMLNIESSIGAELEFQQLTGEQLVDDQGNSITNQIRIARLTGNTGDLVQAQEEFYTKYYDKLKDSPLALEAAAQAMGTTSEEMARQGEIIEARQKLVESMGSDTINSVLEEFGLKSMAQLGGTDENAMAAREALATQAKGNEDFKETMDAYLKATDSRSESTKLEDAINRLTGAILGNENLNISGTLKSTSLMREKISGTDTIAEINNIKTLTDVVEALTNLSSGLIDAATQTDKIIDKNTKQYDDALTDLKKVIENMNIKVNGTVDVKTGDINLSSTGNK